MILSSEETWPKTLLELLNEHSLTLRGYEEHEQRTSGMSSLDMPENPYFQEYEEILKQINKLLEPEKLLGWHCTRLTDSEIQEIQQYGMRLPNPNLLEERISNLINSRIISPEMGEKLKTENSANDKNRKDMIWFCFFHPKIAGQSGIERFFKYWGGEALYHIHQHDPKTSPILESIGKPCLIEAEVPISWLALNFFAEKLVRRYLVNRGFETVEDIEHEDRSHTTIPPDHISRIIDINHKDFTEFTGCNEWEPPLQK